MSSSIIISDASLPFALVFSDTVSSNAISSIVLDSQKQWNPGSVLSAKTAVLNAKRDSALFDRAVLCFDTKVFAESLLQSDTAASIFERYITGYFTMCDAILHQFEKQKTGLLTFALRSFDGNVDQPHLEQTSLLKALHMAEAAFSVLAERTLEDLCARESPVSGLMVRLDGEDDHLNAEWLYSRIYAEKPQKTHVRWVKSGSKNLLGMF